MLVHLPLFEYLSRSELALLVLGTIFRAAALRLADDNSNETGPGLAIRR